MADEAKQVKNYVKHQIYKLTGSSNESSSRAMLANLRRGIATTPGSIPALWEITFNGLPEELCGRDEEPSRGEWAIYTTLTLYALHQQGKEMSQHPMSQEGHSLGMALRKLISNEDEEKRIKRRFDVAATSDSLEEFAHHLRGLIQLLKSQNIPLDYPSLAEDLYWFQNPDVRDSVRLRWGRDFYRIQNKTDINEGKEVTGETQERTENR